MLHKFEDYNNNCYLYDIILPNKIVYAYHVNNKDLTISNVYQDLPRDYYYTIYTDIFKEPS